MTTKRMLYVLRLIAQGKPVSADARGSRSPVRSGPVSVQSKITDARLSAIALDGGESSQTETEGMARELLAARKALRAFEGLQPLKDADHGLDALMTLDDALCAYDVAAGIGRRASQ